MHKIVFTRRVFKDLDKIPKDVKDRIGQKLQEYAQEPLKYAKKLASEKIGTYRFRVGDYRIVFDIENDEIIVLRVGNRRDIYR